MAAKGNSIRLWCQSIFDFCYQQISDRWRQAKIDFVRQPLTTLLTVMVIAISLTLPILGYLIWKNINTAMDQWYPTPQITVYLKKSLNDQSINLIVNEITKMEQVGKINYLPRDQALNEFRQWSGYDDALAMLDTNPLPPVVIVTPADHNIKSEHLVFLRNTLNTLNGVDDARLDDSWFTRLSALTRLVAVIAIVLIILMIVAVFLVIGNSIRLTIFSRRQVIYVMKLIGATDSFIMRPFLDSGALIGFCGAMLALIMSQLLVWGFTIVVSNVTPVFGTSFQLQGLNWDDGLILLIVAVMIGWMAAWLATAQHLKKMSLE